MLTEKQALRRKASTSAEKQAPCPTGKHSNRNVCGIAVLSELLQIACRSAVKDERTAENGSQASTATGGASSEVNGKKIN